MNKCLKKILFSGASLLMLAGIGAGFNNVTKTAHADMPDPEYFHSTRYHDNIYYAITLEGRHGRFYTDYAYGRMPGLMRQRGHMYPLYYGRSFYKQYGHQSFYHLLRRGGQTYYPDYVGYNEGNVRYHGKNGTIMMLYINHRDVGRPVKNQNWAMAHDNIFNRAVKYLPISHYRARRPRRYARRKPRARRPRTRRFRRIRRRNRVKRYAKRAIKKRYRRTRRIKRNRRRKSRFVVKFRKISNGAPSDNSSDGSGDRGNSTKLAPGLKYDANGNVVPKNSAWAARYVHQIEQRTINDINNEREANGQAPVEESNNLDAVAKVRAKQLFNHFTHYDAANNGNPYNAEVGYALGFLGSPTDDEYAENIAEDNLGKVTSTDGNGTYTANNGNDMANYMNDEMVNHDAASNWGHRKNILSPSNRVIGVGAAYDPSKPWPFTLAEEFSYDDTGSTTNTSYPSLYEDPTQGLPKGSWQYVTRDAQGNPTVHEGNATVTYTK